MSVTNVVLKLKLTQLADANGIFLAATPGGAGDLVLNGVLVSAGVATFAEARRIEAIFAADESSKTVTFIGKNRFDKDISESVTGEEINTTTYVTKLDFKEISDINVSAAFAGALTIGTGGRASSEWITTDTGKVNFNVGILTTLLGTSSYFVDVTGQIEAKVELDANVRTIANDAFSAAKSVSFLTSQLQPVKAIRLRLETLGSIQDLLTADINQSGT